MKTRSTACLAMLLMGAPAMAEESPVEKACIIKAAASIPPIVGMEITAGRIMPNDAETQRKFPSNRNIEIETRAVQRTIIYLFICNVKSGQPEISPIGLR